MLGCTVFESFYLNKIPVKAPETVTPLTKDIPYSNIINVNRVGVDQMNKSLENSVVEVLVENFTDDKTKTFGRSKHMTSVIFDGKKNDIGKIVQVKINKSNRSTLFGEIVDNPNRKVA